VEVVEGSVCFPVTRLDDIVLYRPVLCRTASIGAVFRVLVVAV